MTQIPDAPYPTLVGYAHGTPPNNIITAYPVLAEWYAWLKTVMLSDRSAPECTFHAGHARVLTERFGVTLTPLPQDQALRAAALRALRTATEMCNPPPVHRPGITDQLLKDQVWAAQAELCKVEAARPEEWAAVEPIVSVLRSAFIQQNAYQPAEDTLATLNELENSLDQDDDSIPPTAPNPNF